MARLAEAGKLPANADISSFAHAADEPAPGYEWVPVFCAAVGARAEGERTGWARGAENSRAREEWAGSRSTCPGATG